MSDEAKRAAAASTEAWMEDQQEIDAVERRVTSPWLTVRDAAARARVGEKIIYREVKAGRLRAARVGFRRDLRFLSEWVDDWLVASATPVDVVLMARR